MFSRCEHKLEKADLPWRCVILIFGSFQLNHEQSGSQQHHVSSCCGKLNFFLRYVIQYYHIGKWLCAWEEGRIHQYGWLPS